MIAGHNRPGCSYYPQFIGWDALAPRSATSARSSSSKQPLWIGALGVMMRSMSELLMLATSRSPAQWIMCGFDGPGS